VNPRQRIFVALDTTSVAEAASLAERLSGYVGGIKLGKEFFTANGPRGVARVAAGGMPLFLDLKFHDIPNTVAGAVRAALPLKPFLLNVHAGGGHAMMKAAVAAAAGAGSDRPLMLAVTVLTSMGQEDLAAVGVPGSVRDQVVRLATLARDAGMDGVVCSAKEIEPLRAALGGDFKLVVPGIRPTWSETGDQKRIVTPAEAVRLGADFLVIGRPITAAADPVAAARRIAEELG
jgi:orotidine-5'-phosphate decarboxylase